jgi:glycosyltransferase involved in cell wall biosynthesis
MAPLVSILVPAYNSQEWIAETIISALAQTWTRREIIVVDDGSTDRTLEVARRFEGDGVRVVTQANQGAAAARNTAYSLCQGDYIQWLDADDVLATDKIDRQVRKLGNGSTSRTLLSGAWAYFIYRRRKARFAPTPLWSDLSPLEWLTRKMAHNLHMQTDNWLVSRELTEAAGPWDTRLWRDNDGEYFCRVILASDGIRFVPEARSYYRAAGFKSVSYIGGSNKKLESLFLSMNLHIRYLRSLEDSERTRSASVTYIGNWLHEFYPYRLDLADQLKRLCAELGGRPDDPHLSWKYDWIVRLFGWKAGRRAQIAMPKLRASARIAWDRAMFGLEGQEPAPADHPAADTAS